MKAVVFKRSIWFLMVMASAVVPISSTRSKTDKYVIGAHRGGFFAGFLAVLNHLSYCQKYKKIPVVYWRKNSLYYDEKGFNGSKNVWEYYFEPVSPASFEARDATHSGYSAPEFSLHYSHIGQAIRTKVGKFIAKYIKVKPIVQKKVDTFYQHTMRNKQVIGIHIRGTDKGSEEKLVSPEQLVQAALVHAHENTVFLLASDDQRLLDRAQQLLSGYEVIFYPCYRSTNGQPLHHTKAAPEKPSPAQLGEDVLVEALLFARTNLFVHTLSNVSTGVLYFNPALKNIVVRAD